MANPYPIRIQGTDGVATLNGEATFTDPGNQPGGGGSQPKQEIVDSPSGVAIAPGDTANIAWEHADGDTLLDYTDPLIPVVIEAGVYSVAVTVECADGVQLSGSFDAQLGVGAPSQFGSAPLNVTAFSYVQLTVVGVLPAGDPISVNVLNNGPGTLHFGLDAGAVVKIA